MALAQRVKRAAHDAAHDLHTDVDTDVKHAETDAEHPAPIVKREARHLAAHLLTIVALFAGQAILGDVAIQTLSAFGIIQTENPYIDIPVLSDHVRTEEAQS